MYPYINTNEYIEISGRLYELIKDIMEDNRLYFKHEGNMIQYDSDRDGGILDLEQAKDKYPEHFV